MVHRRGVLPALRITTITRSDQPAAGVVPRLWLGLLGIAMAIRLSRILRSGAEVPEDYWRKLVSY